jgi:hypothetical protein
MHDVKHVTPIWYVFTMNATTNIPRPPCLDAVVVEAEVEAEVVAVARPILSSLTSIAPPTRPSLLSIGDGLPLSTHHCRHPHHHRQMPHRHHCTYPFAAVLCQSSWAAWPGGRKILHPSLFVVLLVIFVIVKRIMVVNALSPPNFLSCHPTVTVAATIAMIVVVINSTSLRPYSPHEILPTIGSSQKIQWQQWDCHW